MAERIVGVSRGCRNFLGTHLLSQERFKLRTSNSAGTFTGPSEQKHVKIVEKREYERINYGVPREGVKCPDSSGGFVQSIVARALLIYSNVDCGVNK